MATIALEEIGLLPQHVPNYVETGIKLIQSNVMMGPIMEKGVLLGVQGLMDFTLALLKLQIQINYVLSNAEMEK